MKEGNKLLPFAEVENKLDGFIGKAEQKEGTEIKIRTLQYCISFLEQQYGNPIKGKSYRERGGQRVHNLEISIILSCLCKDLASAYSDMEDQDKTIRFYDKALSLLDPWGTQLDLEKNERFNILDEEDSERIYESLSGIERNFGAIHFNLGNYDMAGEHYEKTISHARRIVSEENNTKYLYEVLMKKDRNFDFSSQFKEAKAVYEEAYNLMTIAHYPNDPIVLETANSLIPVLIQLQDFDDAERYARFLYQELTGKSEDNEGKEVAIAANSLASIIYMLMSKGGIVGDILEAEELSRKSLRIMQRIYGPDFCSKACFQSTLSRVLRQKGNHDAEVKVLMEQCLAFYKEQGNDMYS
jgi:tetratricopeptide (TPR) repeat protein